MAANAPLHIVKADIDVSDITDNAQTMLACVRKNYSCEPTILLHETIHGHIAVLTRLKNFYVPGCESFPLRLDASDFTFLSALPGFRWVEATSRKISLGFTNE